jgi:hypothetical protein
LERAVQHAGTSDEIAMIVLDDSAWPFVCVEFTGAPEPGEQRRVRDQMSKWLARGEKFGVLYLIDRTSEQLASSRGSRDDRADHNEWHRQHRPLFAEHCFGLVTVYTDQRLLEHRKQMSPASTLKLLGCPGASFGARADGDAWLRAMAEHHIGL